MRIGRLLRTLAPFPSGQLVARAAAEGRIRLFRRIPALQRLLLGEVEAPPRVGIHLAAPVRDLDQRARVERFLADGTARLAGCEVPADRFEQPQLPKLVRYHLHYLDLARDLAEVGAAEGRAELLERAAELVAEWARQFPPHGQEAWEPYPVACRLLNLTRVAGLWGPSAPAQLRASMLLHARAAARWPETHLHGNHLWKDACAIASAGLCLEGEEAGALELEGLSLLEEQAHGQVLPDGGHFERSPMYHLRALADALDVQDLVRARGRSLSWLEEVTSRMARFAAAILHPDGDVPLFNDAALGEADVPAKLFARLGAVPPPEAATFEAKTSGLFVARPSRDEALIFDAGPLGPDVQPGHAHSDTLSFELSLGGERRAVNAGLDGYQTKHRAFFRSAVAHNTVTVDGEGPDELWSTFRVGGRAEVQEGSVAWKGSHAVFSGALRAVSGWTQRRQLVYFPGKALVVVDRIDGAHARSVAISRARLCPGELALRFLPLRGDPSVRKTAYAPELGRIFEIDEHSMVAGGASTLLAYALVWGAHSVRLQDESAGLVIEVDGLRLELPSAPTPRVDIHRA